MASGCWQAALALVERFHARACGRWLGARPGVVLCGGDAARRWRPAWRARRVHPDLVLQGLAAWDLRARRRHERSRYNACMPEESRCSSACCSCC